MSHVKDLEMASLDGGEPPQKAVPKVASEPVGITSSGQVSVFGWTLFLTGTLLIGSYPCMAKMTEGLDGQKPVPIPLCILLMETGKLVISLARLTQQYGVSATVDIISKLRWSQLWPYGIPGLLYMINNNIEILILELMDGASFRMLSNGKVASTSLLGWWFLNQRISRQQIVALVLLVIGAGMAAITQENRVAVGNEMFITTTGLVVLVVYCTISGLAGIGNEWIMKRGTGSSSSIHLQNSLLYCWGVGFNLVGALVSMRRERQSAMEAGLSMFSINGFETYSQLTWWWLFILNGIFHGLVISFMVKYLSSVHKLFMGGSSIIVAALLQKFLMGAVALPASWFVAAAIVFLSMYLYNVRGVLCDEVTREE